MLKPKNSYSKIFDDMQLAYGLIKRMNGYAFCYSGDAELVKLGFMIKNNPKVAPYVTVKGKKFLMEVIGKVAKQIDEEKAVKKPKPEKAVKKPFKEEPPQDYWGGDDDEDDEDEEDEVIKKKEVKDDTAPKV